MNTAVAPFPIVGAPVDVPDLSWYDIHGDVCGAIDHCKTYVENRAVPGILSKTHARQGWQSVSTFTRLQKLSIGCWEGLEGLSIPNAISNLVNLEVLELIGLNLQGPLPASLNQLTKLKTLRIGTSSYCYGDTEVDTFPQTHLDGEFASHSKYACNYRVYTTPSNSDATCKFWSDKGYVDIVSGGTRSLMYSSVVFTCT